MRKLILRMLITVDGVAAGENGQIEGVDYGDEGSWNDIFATLEKVDAFLLGGNTYKEYLDYWQSVLTNPKASASERKFAEFDARTPHFVLSRSLKTVDRPNASVLEGGVDGIAGLKNQSGRDILMWGGPTVAAAAIDAGLVDEIHFDIHPIVAGRGKKLFDKVTTPTRLRHLSTETTPAGVVISKHARA